LRAGSDGATGATGGWRGNGSRFCADGAGAGGGALTASRRAPSNSDRTAAWSSGGCESTLRFGAGSAADTTGIRGSNGRSDRSGAPLVCLRAAFSGGITMRSMGRL
jgi:hypothetical protein